MYIAIKLLSVHMYVASSLPYSPISFLCATGMSCCGAVATGVGDCGNPEDYQCECGVGTLLMLWM